MVIYLHVCKCINVCACCFWRPERLSVILELKLQTVVSYHVGAENLIQVLCESSNLRSLHFLPSFLPPSPPPFKIRSHCGCGAGHALSNEPQMWHWLCSQENFWVVDCWGNLQFSSLTYILGFFFLSPTTVYIIDLYQMGTMK